MLFTSPGFGRKSSGSRQSFCDRKETESVPQASVASGGRLGRGRWFSGLDVPSRKPTAHPWGAGTGLQALQVAVIPPSPRTAPPRAFKCARRTPAAAHVCVTSVGVNNHLCERAITHSSHLCMHTRTHTHTHLCPSPPCTGHGEGQDVSLQRKPDA